jgi:phospholipase D-like protein
MQHRTRPATGYAASVNPLTIEQILLLLAPVVLLQLGLMIAALIDLERDERRVRGGRKVVWALIVVFINIIGPILYFTVGREDA